MKKECTEEEARLKAEAYCAMSEHCSDDVYRKLEQWGAPLAAYDSILGYLKKEKFVELDVFLTNLVNQMLLVVEVLLQFLGLNTMLNVTQ